jgi:ribosomal-protein-alanine N-acetyltransferase
MLSFEPMQPGDVPAVVEIDRQSFPTPWPESAFYRELTENRLAHYFVLRELPDRGEGAPGEIIGYVGLWVFHEEAHVTTIAVRPERRGQGYGELILLKAIEAARRLGASYVTLEVRVSNTVAQRLYEKYRFGRVGLRKGYYSDTGEDALIMTVEGIDSLAYRRFLETRKAGLRAKLGAVRCESGAPD